MIARVHEELEIVLYSGIPKNSSMFVNKFLAIRNREFIRVESALVNCNPAIAVVEFPSYARMLGKLAEANSPAEMPGNRSSMRNRRD